MTGLGSMYITGRGVERNHARAVELFREAAEMGEYTAMISYAYHAPISPDQKAHWILRAARADTRRALELIRRDANLLSGPIAHAIQSRLRADGFLANHPVNSRIDDRTLQQLQRWGEAG